MATKLRLLKVIVQAVLVLDDGETLTEQAAEPMTVSAAEWPTFATGRFAQGMEGLRRQVEGDGTARVADARNAAAAAGAAKEG